MVLELLDEELLESPSAELDELVLDDELLDELLLDELLLDEPLLDDDAAPVVVSVVESSPVGASGATNPVEGASVSMKNGLSSMQAGRSRRPKINRFIKISLSRRR